MSADQVAKRVTGKSVEREEESIREQHQCPNAETELAVKPEGLPDIVPKKSDQRDRRKQHIAMDVLQEERKGGLPLVTVWHRFTDGAGWRVGEEGAVVSFAIVVAGGPESERGPQNQKGGRPTPPVDKD